MTIAGQYNGILEHRGKPAAEREESTYVDDPYDMTSSEYGHAKRRIKRKWKEKNRAAQKQLTASAWAAWRRKKVKRAGFREKKNKELRDLKTKFNRSQIDQEYGNRPGRWSASIEKGKYPVGTQGKPKGQQSHAAGYQLGQAAARQRLKLTQARAGTTRKQLGPAQDWIEGDWRQMEEPGYLPQAHRRDRSTKRIAAVDRALVKKLGRAQPSRKALPPAPPPTGGQRSPVKALPSQRSVPRLKAAQKDEPRTRQLQSGRRLALPPAKKPIALLTAAKSATKRVEK